MTKRTLFISDLHLSPQLPALTELFLNWLKQQDSTVDALYILGDFFEAWVGDDDESPFSQELKTALQVASKRFPIYFQQGNRDFLLGSAFAAAANLKLLPEEHRIDLYGTPVLLMHGDLLCTLDTRYLKTRQWFHKPWLQWIFLQLPRRYREKIAERLRAKSTDHTKSAQAKIMDVSQEAVQNVMNRYAVNTLIHGHTHRPAFHEFTYHQTPQLRIVLGAWHERGNVLIWSETGHKIWEEFGNLTNANHPLKAI